MYHITVSPKDCLQCKLSLPLLLVVDYLWQAGQKIDYCYKLFHDPSAGAIEDRDSAIHRVVNEKKWRNLLCAILEQKFVGERFSNPFKIPLSSFYFY